jgi:hypothetical protein
MGAKTRGMIVLAAALAAGVGAQASFGSKAWAQASGQTTAAVPVVPAPAEFAGQRRGDEASDWPCAQRKVAKLSPATVWTGPAIDGLDAEWSKDDSLQDLARALASRRTAIEEAGKLITAFSASQDPASKQRRLTLLFAATFSEIDKLRAEILHGIERYTRNQRKLAHKIDEERAESQALQQVKERSEADKKVAQEKEDQMAWEMRVYKERENSLRYVCENPVVLEQRLYQLAQEIQKQM